MLDKFVSKEGKQTTHKPDKMKNLKGLKFWKRFGRKKDTAVKSEAARRLEELLKKLSVGTNLHRIKSPKVFTSQHFHLDVKNNTFLSADGKPTSIDLSKVDEVRKGMETDIFHQVLASDKAAKDAPDITPEKSFSLIMTATHKTYDFVAKDESTRDDWVTGLSFLVASLKASEKREAYKQFLKEKFRAADKDKNGSLSFNECKKLLQHLNVKMEDKHALDLFNKANIRKRKNKKEEEALDPEEFVEFFYSLSKRPEIEELFKKYRASGTNVFGVEALMEFFQVEQKFKDVTSAYALQIIKIFEGKDAQYMSLEGFRDFLLSDECDIFNKAHRHVYQDMTQPLTHYYIASSHNTYLTGSQLYGDSSIEAYIMALKKGCRCLEIDIHDGSDGEPIVYHGHTLTTKILFSNVVSAISSYAFRASEYPVILSLENHCSVPQQQKMAEYMRKSFGETLCLDDYSGLKELPSPEALRHKVIIKGKKMKDPKAKVEEVTMVDIEEAEEDSKVAQPPPKMTLAKELSDLVNYCQANHFKSFDDSLKNWECYKMASFMEVKAGKFVKEMGRQFVKYNVNHLARIYPKGSRTSSSNYLPTPMWTVGCQMVALNYQTIQIPMMLNDGRFIDNGQCGYVLKPKFLRSDKSDYNPVIPPDHRSKKTLIIEIISGQNIPKPFGEKRGDIVDPFVVCNIFGHPKDDQKHKTKPVSNNGFNPQWNEKFTLEVLMPDLAIFLIRVKDKNPAGKNELLGYFSLPFNSIQEGYRHVHLWDNYGQPLLVASLFVRIEIK